MGYSSLAGLRTFIIAAEEGVTLKLLRRYAWTKGLVACLAAGALTALVVTQFASAGHTSNALVGRIQVTPVAVTVTLGAPSEYILKISKKDVPVGTVNLTVHNSGTVGYVFKVCTSILKGANVDSCTGTATKLIGPGQSAMLTVKLAAKGTYELLCTVPSNAAKSGMTARIGIGEEPTPAPATTAPTTTTAVGGLIGNPTAGKTVFVAEKCGSCHTLAAAGSHGTIGPNLDELMPSQTTVKNQVISGGGFMPSFGGLLTKTQIDDVAAYVYASTHK